MCMELVLLCRVPLAILGFIGIVYVQFVSRTADKDQSYFPDITCGEGLNYAIIYTLEDKDIIPKPTLQCGWAFWTSVIVSVSLIATLISLILFFMKSPYSKKFHAWTVLLLSLSVFMMFYDWTGEDKCEQLGNDISCNFSYYIYVVALSALFVIVYAPLTMTGKEVDQTIDEWKEKEEEYNKKMKPIWEAEARKKREFEEWQERQESHRRDVAIYNNNLQIELNS